MARRSNRRKGRTLTRAQLREFLEAMQRYYATHGVVDTRYVDLARWTQWPPRRQP